MYQSQYHIVLSLWKRCVDTSHEEAMKHLNVNAYSFVLSPIGLSKAKTTSCVYLCITIVNYIALRPAVGASFCLLSELLARRIRIL